MCEDCGSLGSANSGMVERLHASSLVSLCHVCKLGASPPCVVRDLGPHRAPKEEQPRPAGGRRWIHKHASV